MKIPIELRHLRYFVRVAEELHFGRAAEHLGIAQAPLSQQIRQLEERLGVRLFDRTTRQVRLTAAGELFLEHARRAIADVEVGIDAVRSSVGNTLGHLRISTVYIALYRFLPEIIRRFRRRYPNVGIDIQVHTTDEQVQLLSDGRIDVGFVRPPKSPANLLVERVFSEGFVAVLPKGHPLARRAALTLSELRDEPFLAYSPIMGVGYQDVVMQHCRLAGFRPRVVQQVSHTLAIITLVAAGVGVGVVPAWVTVMPSEEVVYRPLAELPAAVDLALAWSADDVSPLVHHFVTVTRDVACALGEEGSRLPAEVA